ncbi:MAG: hypothetical protein MAG453_00676 [Calditrichaeota bacterium]|nr:hypothetical protein [Calditrichota bacterium]
MAGSAEWLLEQLLREQRIMIEEQKSINRLLRFVAHRQARELIETRLEKGIERRVYELSDGFRSSRDIEKAVNKEVTQRTVVTWWQKWRRLGLVEQSPRYSGRMQKVLPLEELGLSIDSGDK